MISFVLSISGPFRQSWPNSSSRLDADERKPIVQGTQSSHQVPVGAELRLCKFPPPSLVRRLLGKFCHAAGNNLWHVSPLPQYENFGKLFPSFLGTTNCFLGTFYATKVISIVFGNYKLLFGSFLCNKSFFHFFGGNYKLLLGNFFATKAALVCGTFHLVMKNFGLLFYCFGDYEMVLEKFSCNWGPPRSCGDHVVWDSLNDVLKQMVHYFIVIRN